MKMCSSSVEPMPSRIGLPVFCGPSLVDRRRQRLAGRHREPQAGDVGALVRRLQHREVRGRRGEADGRLVGLDDLQHVGRRCGLQQRRRRAEAQREDRESAEAEGESERRRADKHVVRRHAQHFLGIAVGDDQQIAVEVHGRLGLARGARGERQQRNIVAAGVHRLEPHVLVERDPVHFRIVVGGAVEPDHFLEELVAVGAGDELIHDARVAQGERDLGLIDDLGQLARPQHRHGVDDDRAGLGGGQPAGDHGRIVGGADQHAVAGLDAVVLDQRMRDPVAPVRQLLVGAAAAVADQRDMIAEATLDHPVGQLDRGVQPFGIREGVQQVLRLQVRRRQVVPREGVDVRCRSEHRHVLPIKAAHK